MKEIKTYIRPGLLGPVISQLEEAGVKDLTVIRVDAFAAMADRLEEEHRILRKYSQKYGAVVKLEIVCRDENARRFADIIRKSAAPVLYYSVGGKYQITDEVCQFVDCHVSERAVVIASERLNENPTDWIRVAPNHVLTVTSELAVNVELMDVVRLHSTHT